MKLLKDFAWKGEQRKVIVCFCLWPAAALTYDLCKSFEAVPRGEAPKIVLNVE